MKTILKSTISEEEAEEIKKGPNVVELKQQPNGAFAAHSSESKLPLVIVNEILEAIHKIYTDKIFDKAFSQLPEEHVKYQRYLERRCNRLRFLNLIFFGIMGFLILYVTLNR